MGWEMTEERDQPAGAAHGTRGPRETEDPGPEVAFLPPVDVTIDVPDFRYAKLSKIVAEQVVPRLLALHEEARQSRRHPPFPAPPTSANWPGWCWAPRRRKRWISSSSSRTGASRSTGCTPNFWSPRRATWATCGPTTRIDFVDVTLGVARLQRLVHVFEGLDQVPDYDDKRTGAAGLRAGRTAQLRQHHRAEIPARRRLAGVDLLHPAHRGGRRPRLHASGSRWSDFR